jgi:hypothetical protein
MRAATLLALAAMAAGLGACEARDQKAAGNARLCLPFPAAPVQPGAVTPAAAADPAGPLDDCLHRWGYALAASDDDPAETVAQAAVAACHPTLTRWNQDTLAAAGSDARDAGEAPSLTTGEPMNPFAAHHAFAQARALFYVVQARAGHCTAPPFKDGAPTTAPS